MAIWWCCGCFFGTQPASQLSVVKYGASTLLDRLSWFCALKKIPRLFLNRLWWTLTWQPLAENRPSWLVFLTLKTHMNWLRKLHRSAPAKAMMTCPVTPQLSQELAKFQRSKFMRQATLQSNDRITNLGKYASGSKSAKSSSTCYEDNQPQVTPCREDGRTSQHANLPGMRRCWWIWHG